ncbi:MAG: alanine racemase [Prolixibacteraceae bacterium]|nr:alanine racemase [Prolixibacteraceae bacterium]
MNEIIRPTFVIDKQICLRNIEKMAQKAADNGLRFRPHFKTHQSAEIGEWFRSFGVKAITVSSLQMANYFASNGWTDITLAFPVNILEIDEINQLAKKIKLNVLVENKEAAQALAVKIINPLGVYIKIDTGFNRTGIAATETGSVLFVLNALLESKYLDFKGFLSHAGHSYRTKSTNEIFTLHFDALLQLKSLKNRFLRDFPNAEISIGDTPSCTICENFSGVDEIRPGNFVFYDLMQQNLGVCHMEDIAVRVVCPVVAKHISRNEIVIYGGAVHLSKEPIININGKPMYGRIIVRKNGKPVLLEPLNYVHQLSQEHGILKVTHKEFDSFKVGDLVEIIPVHSCLTANLARKYLTTEGEEILTANS